jgi:hypothetical protein
MSRKKQVKKTQKNKKFHVKPDVVVDTTHMASKEEQADNPLNRMKMSEAENRAYEHKPNLKLPEGFKTADNLTEVDDLKFELGRLREMLSAFLDKITIDGKMYNVLVDPMNRVVEITPNNG